MIQVAIVEDDQQNRECLKKYLKRYEQETENKFAVHMFKDGMDIVNEYSPIYDVILLDIQMEKLDGMSAAAQIRKVDNEVILVFITNMVQYAVKGYAVNALDYLLKPLSYFTFAEHMKRVEKQLAQRQKKYLVLNTAGGIIKVDTNDIYYMESQGHYIQIHKKTETIEVLGTMRGMEQSLCENGFFRCNNGYLVNLAHVEKVDKYMAFVGKDIIQISRPKKKAFMEALTDYLGGKGK